MLKLLEIHSELKPFIRTNPANELTINFDDPEAVKALNTALLKHYYALKDWRIPAGFLCPPIPGRADYIHHLADLFPNPQGLRGLDIGVGANVIYPLIGHKSYGWSFIGADINQTALSSAQENVNRNGLKDMIQLRWQKNPEHIFRGIISKEDYFDFTMCNPPFHSSAQEAQAGSQRKKKNLGLRSAALNFGGHAQELWCEGGERSFISTMISESQVYSSQVGWFTTLVSREANLPIFRKTLDEIGCKTVKLIEMAQGQKKSRILAWNYR